MSINNMYNKRKRYESLNTDIDSFSLYYLLGYASFIERSIWCKGWLYPQDKELIGIWKTLYIYKIFMWT